MPRAIKVLEVENSHFTIRVYEDLLKTSLKGSLKNEIEEALENKPVLKVTIGSILGIFVPLHIRVSEIYSVHMTRPEKSLQASLIIEILSFRSNVKTMLRNSWKK